MFRQTVSFYLMLFNGAFTLLAFCQTCTNKHDGLAISYHLICDKLRGRFYFHLICAEAEGIIRHRIALANNTTPKSIFQLWSRSYNLDRKFLLPCSVLDFEQRQFHGARPDFESVAFPGFRDDISDFVQNLFLPRKLTKKPGEADDESLPPSQFPPQIWQKIDQVQQIGGTEALSRIMNGIMRKSSYLINELENLLKSLEAEDKDDQMCRQRYRDKWIRQPSQKLNLNLNIIIL